VVGEVVVTVVPSDDVVVERVIGSPVDPILVGVPDRVVGDDVEEDVGRKTLTACNCGSSLTYVHGVGDVLLDANTHPTSPLGKLTKSSRSENRAVVVIP